MPGRRKRKQKHLPLEQELHQQGLIHIAGIDEVGRGCLAGPVFAGAVVLPPGLKIPGVDDSKKLTPKIREQLFWEITGQAIAWSVGSATPEEIDSINIHHASLLAMRRAIEGLSLLPDYLLVDGLFPVPIAIRQQPIVKGDARVQLIAAASIVAKVSRDHWMEQLALEHPGYGFERHKGYGTDQHRQAIRKLGPTPLHRRSFRLF